jgi:hypothetical protein
MTNLTIIMWLNLKQIKKRIVDIFAEFSECLSSLWKVEFLIQVFLHLKLVEESIWTHGFPSNSKFLLEQETHFFEKFCSANWSGGVTRGCAKHGRTSRFKGITISMVNGWLHYIRTPGVTLSKLSWYIFLFS